MKAEKRQSVYAPAKFHATDSPMTPCSLRYLYTGRVAGPGVAWVSCWVRDKRGRQGVGEVAVSEKAESSDADCAMGGKGRKGGREHKEI